MKFLTSLAVFFISWEVFYHLLINDPFLLSPPSKVIPTFLQLLLGKDELFFIPLDTLHSLYHYAYGFLVALSTGLSLGLVAGLYRSFRDFIHPTIELLRPIPPIAWIPISIMLFKLTHSAAAFIIFIGAFFPILINTIHGVSSVERKYIEAAKTLGAKTRDVFFKVVIPASLPSIFTGIRIASGVAWMCVVAAELFGVSQFGLGYKIQLARYYHSMDVLIAYMLAIGIVGLTLDHFYRSLEKKFLKWRRGLTIE
ncbi:MAG: ABC transporter permease [Archaeoglobaceae archaeon]|nr:ABC transporter permease [Archaeoglobaceae archaeon]MCX8152559.1 ABC transporter permease [Archaeoglobaceae archaeon]MDW8014159.1 ABC transporter permease [Archaeoglobaceae archaeon]